MTAGVPGHVFAAAFLLAMSAGGISAQSTPQELASAIAERWSSGSQTEFEAVFPFAEGRKTFSELPRRVRGLGDVIRADSETAVILLSGASAAGNPGSATYRAAGFSGVYRARRSAGLWKLDAPIPLDALGRLLAQRMTVQVRPGAGLTVEDRMHVMVNGAAGFAARLNHGVKIAGLRTESGDVRYLFGGGLLWMDLPRGEADITLRYSLKIPADRADSNSACFLPEAGHVRDQFLWTPQFGPDAVGDWASFDVEVRIPAEFRASTSLPQTERVEDGVRVIHGQTPRALAITLVYDRDWVAQTRKCGNAQVDILMPPGAKPDPAEIGAAFCAAYDLFSRRFGSPAGNHFGVVQARSRLESSGWGFLSNSIVVAPATLRAPSTLKPVPSAPLGHEVAHLWTQGLSGPGAGFLSEGWAVWAENLLLEKEFGGDASAAHWNTLRQIYFLALDGNGSLMDDRWNTGIAYIKGPWIYRMLEDALGVDGFDRAMSEFWSPGKKQRQGWEDLAKAVQEHAPNGFDAQRFLSQWLTGKQVPHLTTEVRGSTVIIHSDLPEFHLDITVEASTGKGRERVRASLDGAVTKVTFSGDASEVKVDPEGRLLVH